MDNYFKYLPVSEEDKSWGLHVLNAGHTLIKPKQPYPAKTHPSDHYFSWENGRVLDEYQLIYFPNGSGSFESKTSGETTISPGSIVLLFPYEWHRYKPGWETGWQEYWIGFNGPVMDNLRKRSFFTRQSPVMQTGVSPLLINLFEEALSYIKQENPGYQQAAAGVVYHLLGAVYSVTKQEAISTDGKYDEAVRLAISRIRESIEGNISLEDLSKELDMSYSSFRKIFKSSTGIAPHQYLLQLKLEKGKRLLLKNKQSIKQIADELGFESASYFSKIFKKKNKVSPEEYRRALLRVA